MRNGGNTTRPIGLFMIGLLSACGPATLPVSGLLTEQSGVMTHAIRLTREQTSHAYVCYSEVSNNQLTGVACQTDTGLPFFSAALDQGTVTVTQTAAAVHAYRAEQVIGYLTIALFDEYRLLSRQAKRLLIDKRPGRTLLSDPSKDLSIEVQRL